MLDLEFVQSLGGVVGGIHQLAPGHPLRLVVQNVFPGRLYKKLPVLFQGLGK